MSRQDAGAPSVPHVILSAAKDLAVARPVAMMQFGRARTRLTTESTEHTEAMIRAP